ncbi:hypothetical protein SNOG_14004 [Parastagonospora nodorum SN15]|uniref:Uncharacterized protein n=1 Tax=Phaeosphaeria nodorum (strain SN15 / ATCC MYA-4574 / FGSC 10173) TaxID=321614 RepID=Q0U2C9_PHANO|nr:hypothetical protein SNOG_14004 [Parastagonospora nodorum SN15]EAT78629.1 hypothetical protein SNOG_14004 [Parastagonospora nodorum SN15]
MWKLRDVRREVAARPYHTCDAHDIKIRACLRLRPAAAIDRRPLLDTVLFTAAGTYRGVLCSLVAPLWAPGILDSQPQTIATPSSTLHRAPRPARAEGCRDTARSHYADLQSSAEAPASCNVSESGAATGLAFSLNARVPADPCVLVRQAAVCKGLVYIAQPSSFAAHKR